VQRRAISKSKTPPALKPIDAVDWTGVRLQRLEYEPAGTIFAQGDPAPSVMYVETVPSGCPSCRMQAKRR
jgi:hypothetical protein